MDERFPLKLRVTFKRERKYYATGYDVSEAQWNIINSTEAKGKLRTIRNAIGEIEIRAQKCCDEIPNFTFLRFENTFFAKRIQPKNLEAVYNAYIEELQKNNQFGTADSYRSAFNALKRFKSNLNFEHITKEFLQSFEDWMITSGKSISTVGIYLRPLRAILNVAMDNRLILHEDYPFGKRKYVIPTGRNIKKALDIQQIKQIFDYKTLPGTGIDKAKDFWIFSYLCNGMNFMDIARLKWKNVDGSAIYFIREKTRRSTKANPINITAVRNTHIDAILDKWGQKPALLDNYIFNIINNEDSNDIARNKIKQFTKVTNGWMKQVGKSLNIDITLTTYVARHSFATILVRSGAPMKLASQSLGHQNISTTEKYFAGFDIAIQARYAQALTNF